MTKQLVRISYQRLISDISRIYEQAKLKSIQAVNKITISAYWNIGRNIVEVEQQHNIRAEYGTHLFEDLSRDLTKRCGKGFSATNLKYMRQFYITYPIGHVRDQLEWTHYRLLLSIKDRKKRNFYEKQIIKCDWNSIQLEEILKRDRIKLQDFRLKKLLHKQSQPMSKIRLTRGKLYTYRLIKPKYIKSIRSGLLIDCGFSLWREMPLKGITNLSKGDSVESIKTKEGFRFKHSQAKKNQFYTYKAFVEKVTDADTIWVNIDLGFDNWMRQKLRLRGIDAPEVSTQKGKKAKQFVEAALRDTPFVIIKTHGSDKYDRYLVDVFYLVDEENPQVVLEQGTFLNQQLLDLGLAKVL
ncbi:MAG: thermonuclease family protein [Candidatus Omnitrophica bacterium]|nr:thermonuclease family protein [Candidatus Omnitrophota bacterium]